MASKVTCTTGLASTSPTEKPVSKTKDMSVRRP